MKRLGILVLIVWSGIAGWAGAYGRYYVVDLTELATNAGAPIIPAYGYAINDAGMVTGHAYPPGNTNAKPYLYNRETETFINIGNLAGDFNGDGYGGNGYSINNQGVVTGRDSISNTSWAYRAFLYSDINQNGTVDTGELVNLNPEEGTNIGYDINNSNQVIGINSTTSTGWVWTDFNHNFQLDEGEKQYFSGLTGISINDSGAMILNSTSTGQIILWNDPNGDGVYEDSDKKNLPMPGSDYSSMSGNSINNNGDICGSAKYLNTSKNQGFFWTDSNHDGVVDANEYTIFGSNSVQTYPRAMNNLGQVVGGTFEYGSQRAAFIWTKDEGMANLNNLFEYNTIQGPALVSQAEAINNMGIILASGWYDTNLDGKRNATTEPEHAFVLIPCPDGDIDIDGTVNYVDFDVLASHYGLSGCTSENSYCGGADVTQDGAVDMQDLEIMAKNWLIKIW